MTTPSDFRPEDAMAVRDESDSQGLDRRIWALRLAGVALLVAVWFVVSLRDIGSTNFIVETLAFGILGCYGFLAATASRKAAVDQERKLRFRLLVRNMELEQLAKRDDLTQLFNRHHLLEQMEKELQTAKEMTRPLAIVIADLNSLASVNDTSDHRIGDNALAKLGQLLLDHARASDVPARIGGDEFAIILPDTSERGAHTVVNRLADDIEKTDLVDDDDNTRRLTVSFGISGYPWGSDTVDGIIQHAYASMGSDRQPDEGAVPAIFRKSLESFDDVLDDAEEPQA